MLNQEKTELTISKPKHQLKVNGKIHLQVGEKTVNLARSVNNLDVYLDKSLTNERHLNAISRILNIGRIGQCITA